MVVNESFILRVVGIRVFIGEERLVKCEYEVQEGV